MATLARDLRFSTRAVVAIALLSADASVWAQPVPQPAPHPPHTVSPRNIKRFYKFNQCNVDDFRPLSGVLPKPEKIDVEGVTIRFFRDPADLKYPVKKRLLIQQ